MVVLEGGSIVEAGPPAVLASRPGSRYARLLAAERELVGRGWGRAEWTRWHVTEGVLTVVKPAIDRGRGGA